MKTIANQIAKVRLRIAAAAERAGRSPDEVTLIAVSKKVAIGPAQEALAAGAPNLGEARVQEAQKKRVVIGSNAIWHMIGPLQTNKAKYCPGLFDLIHSIDRADLMLELDKRAGRAGITLRGLVQVNITGERQKSGCAPEDAEALLAESTRLDNLSIVGLMTIPPFADDPEKSRPVYARLRALREKLRAQNIAGVSLDILSAGMSGDYEIAIEEGATMVRVGTAIFGSR